MGVLAGKIALVTGASKGIGAGIAKGLAAVRANKTSYGLGASVWGNNYWRRGRCGLTNMRFEMRSCPLLPIRIRALEWSLGKRVFASIAISK